MYKVAKQTKEVSVEGEKIKEKIKKEANPVHRLSKERDEFANENGKEDDPSVIRRSGCGTHNQGR